MELTTFPGQTLCVALAALIVLLGRASAQNSHSTGQESWQVDSSGTLRTGGWPLDQALRLDFSMASEKEGDGDAADKKAPPPPAKLPPLEYGSDKTVTLLGAFEGKGGAKISYTVTRSIAFDVTRRAVRVLDVITNTDGIDHPTGVGYGMKWTEAAASKIAQPRQFFVSGTQNPVGVLVTTTDDQKLPILMCVFGADGRGWNRKLSSTQEGLSWKYTGVLRAHQRLVLLHWVTLVEDARTSTVQDKRRSLIRDGMPAEPKLGKQVLLELANFPVPQEPPAVGGLEWRPAALHFLDALCKEVGLERTPDADQLLAPGGLTLKGTFSAGQIRLHENGQTKELLLADIAAVQGGGGVARRHRVYMRDGTVTGGMLSWTGGMFEDASLGTMSLSPQAMGTVILRHNESDGSAKGGSGVSVLQNGDARLLEMAPQGALRVRWAAGEAHFPWGEVVGIRRRSGPSIAFEIFLTEGSRICGWPDLQTAELPFSLMLYAKSWPDLTALSRPEGIASAGTLAARLLLRDGSSLTGSIAADRFSLEVQSASIDLPTQSISRLVASPPDSPQGKPMLEVTVAEGKVVGGRPCADVLSWRRGSETVEVPWSLVREVVTPEAPTPKQPQ